MDYCGPFTAHSGYCERLKAFVSINLEWIQDQIATQPNSPYWHQVHGLLGLFFQAQSPLWFLNVNGLEISFFVCFLWGASGTAAAERSGGQLQRTAVFSYWTVLIQPIWLHVNDHLSFLNKWILFAVNKMINLPSHCCLCVYSSRLFQLGGDLEDLESALNKSSQTRPLGAGSCSALIKLLPNHKDLLISHDTWNTYQSMLRIIKKYMFAFKVSPVGN